MSNNPLSAYQTIEQSTMSGRATEARVLTKAAMLLKECQDNWDAADRKGKLHQALEYNQRIWSIIQGSLLENDNPLPKEVKQHIMVLSAYIDKRIFDIMAYPASHKLSIIIDINLNLAAGLRS